MNKITIHKNNSFEKSNADQSASEMKDRIYNAVGLVCSFQMKDRIYNAVGVVRTSIATFSRWNSALHTEHQTNK